MMMGEAKRKRVVLIGYWFSLSVLIGGFFLLFNTFLSAYLHPSKTVTICVDMLGEANLEFVLLCVGAVVVGWFMFDVRKRVIERMREGEL